MNAIDPKIARPENLTPEERDARTNTFLASEAFDPFVLECFTRGVRRAVAEEADPTESAKRPS